MQPIEIIAQIMGVFGMIFISSSYLFKAQRSLILTQMLGAGFFFVNFLLLGIASGVLLIGAVMNLLGVLRAIVFANKKLFHADRRIWLFGFITTYAMCYVIAFVVFGTPPSTKNFVIELLPVIGMTSSTVAFFKTEAKATRRLGFITSPCWLVYDFFNLSIGGVITEVLSLVSIVAGTIKHDIVKKQRQNSIKNDITVDS